jgi:hypothetical protein
MATQICIGGRYTVALQGISCTSAGSRRGDSKIRVSSTVNQSRSRQQFVVARSCTHTEIVTLANGSPVSTPVAVLGGKILASVPRSVSEG